MPIGKQHQDDNRQKCRAGEQDRTVARCRGRRPPSSAQESRGPPGETGRASRRPGSSAPGRSAKLRSARLRSAKFRSAKLRSARLSPAEILSASMLKPASSATRPAVLRATIGHRSPDGRPRVKTACGVAGLRSASGQDRDLLGPDRRMRPHREADERFRASTFAPHEFRHETGRGAIEDGVGSPDLQTRPAAHHGDPVRQRQGLPPDRASRAGTRCRFRAGCASVRHCMPCRSSRDRVPTAARPAGAASARVPAPGPAPRVAAGRPTVDAAGAPPGRPSRTRSSMAATRDGDRAIRAAPCAADRTRCSARR